MKDPPQILSLSHTVGINPWNFRVYQSWLFFGINHQSWHFKSLGVCHSGLLHKLFYYGIPFTLYSWISRYLSDRLISVIVEGHSFSLYLVNTGVPQGSVLEPTPFLLNINDLLCSTSNFFQFYAADDSTFQAPKAAFPSCIEQQLKENVYTTIERYWTNSGLESEKP